MKEMKNFKISISPRADIERQENVGDCFRDSSGDHFYLVRQHDVLHVGDDVINTLYDNTITAGRIYRNKTYVPIKRSEFNQKLNETIFKLNIFAKEFKD